MYVCVGVCPSKHGSFHAASSERVVTRPLLLLLLLRNTEQTSIWMAWLRHAQEKKGDTCEKNNDYNAVWWSERSMKVCGAHYIV